MHDITAVTGFYDIGRGRNGDGRTADWYLGQLNQTLQIPLPFIVFFDPRLDAAQLALKPGDRLVRIPVEEYEIMRYRAQVEAACARLSQRDLTARMPIYGMLVTGKFEMLTRAADMTDSPVLLWADAGIARFLPEGMSGAKLDPGALARFGDTEFGVNATPNLEAVLQAGRLPKGFIGSSVSLMNATDMYMTRAAAPRINAALLSMLKDEWLPNGWWDNEQVSLGCLILKGLFNVQLTQISFGFGNITRTLFGLPLDMPAIKFHDRIRLLKMRYTAGLTHDPDQYEASPRARALLTR